MILVLSGCSSNSDKAGVVASQLEFMPKPISVETIFYIEIDWDEHVKFFGYLDKTSSSSATGGPLYVGDAGVAGVIAQIAIHAVISNSIQTKKKEDAQNRADQVLSKYLDIVESIDHYRLFQSIFSHDTISQFNIRQNAGNQNFISHDVIVALNPIYYLAPDEKALMLLMDMRVHRRSTPEEIIFEQAVKAISKPISSDDHEEIWKSGIPANFETTSHRLFAEALSLLLEDLTQKKTDKQTPEKTYKYFFGGKKRYERASLIRQSCERIYIRNLKRNIVAIPRSDCVSLASDTLEVRDI